MFCHSCTAVGASLLMSDAARRRCVWFGPLGIDDPRVKVHVQKLVALVHCPNQITLVSSPRPHSLKQVGGSSWPVATQGIGHRV